MSNVSLFAGCHDYSCGLDTAPRKSDIRPSERACVLQTGKQSIACFRLVLL